jgi:hypothetical protein
MMPERYPNLWGFSNQAKSVTSSLSAQGVYMVVTAALLAIDVANLKQGDDPMTAITTGPMMARTQSEESKNEEIIHQGFAKWANGTGSFFDLLADDVEWTIIGSSPISKTYTSRKQFLEQAIAPINERLSVKIVPRVQGIRKQIKEGAQRRAQRDLELAQEYFPLGESEHISLTSKAIID